MAYRYFCIFEKATNGRYKLRVEVALDTGGKSLLPFKRKVNLSHLQNVATNQEQSNLINFLCQSGATELSPFEVNNPLLLSHSTVIDILQKQPFSYSQLSPKASLSRSTCPLKIKRHPQIPIGKLLHGELYIDSIQSWNTNIRVMIRYEDAINSFFPFFNEIPFVLTDGSLALRDYEAEKKLLTNLPLNYDSSKGRLSLKDANTSILSELVDKGWKLFVPNLQKGHSSLYKHTTSSGIIWFSTESTDNDYQPQILDAFLKSRNYIESDGQISIFNRKDALQQADDEFASQVGASQDVLSLYSVLNNISKPDIEHQLMQNLRATLRSYQLDGVLWLQQQRANHCGCLLADEMGLGKTIQVIAHLCCLPSDTNHLVIAPVSLLYNWQEEVARFAPQLLEHIRFVSYDTLRIHLADYMNRNYDTLVIDEAQTIKNRDTKRYKAIAQLKCRHRIILTGTPIENSVEDMWSHFLLLNPPLRTLHDKLRKICANSTEEVYVTLSSKLLRPFILRRTKDEVLKQLPSRTEKNIYVELSQKETLVYEHIHQAVLAALKTGISGRATSIVLEALLRLRQACVSANMLPVTLTRSGHIESTKLNLALEYVRQFKSEGRKVLVFSQFVKALREFETMLSKNDIDFKRLYGDTTDRKTLVQQFQTDKTINAFLISLKAGGVGLNLTAADRVILLDDWWNPAVEEQAMGRAHRIGQQHPVLVLRFICKNTVEEKILLLQQQKKHTADLFEQQTEKLTMDDIRTLIE